MLPSFYRNPEHWNTNYYRNHPKVVSYFIFGVKIKPNEQVKKKSQQNIFDFRNGKFQLTAIASVFAK